jgi:hypothetical protein
MNLFQMKGSWGDGTVWLYSQIIAAGVMPLYEGLAEAAVPVVRSGGMVLEVGCGGGQVTVRLARRLRHARVLVPTS